MKEAIFAFNIDQINVVILVAYLEFGIGYQMVLVRQWRPRSRNLILQLHSVGASQLVVERHMERQSPKEVFEPFEPLMLVVCLQETLLPLASMPVC